LLLILNHRWTAYESQIHYASFWRDLESWPKSWAKGRDQWHGRLGTSMNRGLSFGKVEVVLLTLLFENALLITDFEAFPLPP
jgi:hypothetical protein